MRACCAICGDLFVGTQDDICAAPCGHTYHTPCIHQWLERSKSCPSCRAKTTNKTLNKLYFDIRSSDGETEDPVALQQQADNLKFQIKLKEQEIKKNKESADKANAQAVALREEFKESERIIKEKDTKILALKTQVQYVERASDEAKKAKAKMKKLMDQLRLMEGVEQVLKGTAEDVQALLNSQNGNANDLANYCIILKKGLSNAEDEKMKLRTAERTATRKCKEAEKKVIKLEQEVESLTTSLSIYDQDIQGLEKENRNLKKQIGALEQAIASPSDDVRSSVLHRLLHESPAPEIMKRLYTADMNDSFVTPEVVRKKPRTEGTEEKEEEKEEKEEEEEEEEEEPRKVEVIDLTSPPPSKNISITSSFKRPLADNGNILKGTKGKYASVSTKHKNMNNNNSNSQSWKSRKLVGSDVGYDGMGGHHKFEEFPRPDPILAPIPTRILHKQRKKKDVTSANKPTNKLTNYFQNTFED